MAKKWDGKECYLTSNYNDNDIIICTEKRSDFEKDMLDVMLSLLSFEFQIRDVCIWYSYYKAETSIEILMKKYKINHDNIRSVLASINKFLNEMSNIQCDYNKYFNNKIRIKTTTNQNILLCKSLNRFIKMYLGDSYDVWFEKEIESKSISYIKEKYKCSNTKIYYNVNKVNFIFKNRAKHLKKIYDNIICFKKNTKNKEICWE